MKLKVSLICAVLLLSACSITNKDKIISSNIIIKDNNINSHGLRDLPNLKLLESEKIEISDKHHLYISQKVNNIVETKETSLFEGYSAKDTFYNPGDLYFVHKKFQDNKLELLVRQSFKGLNSIVLRHNNKDQIVQLPYSKEAIFNYIYKFEKNKSKCEISHEQVFTYSDKQTDIIEYIFCSSAKIVNYNVLYNN